MKRKLIVRSLIGLSALVMLLALADSGSAQRKRETRGRGMTKAQVKIVINRVEDRVDNFVKNFDRSLDRSKLDGTSREDWLMNRARDLESATDELSREFDRRDIWAENKEEVRKCLKIASDIDHNIRRNRYGSATESNWSRVRYELNTLADIYNLPKVSSMVYG
ncbi:MAG: hypothetical protein K1X36_11745 [Pyrinomonadaceae bacterium]|nr:hypothetical protein [Pyrinomonadaceae bacterium]